MPEYIEREALIEFIKQNTPNINGETTIECVERAIRTHPTADAVEVVRCNDCKFATELDKHCELNRAIYKHCSLLRGEPTNYVWHKHKRYYKNYSLVEADDYCSYGELKDGDTE